MASKKDLIQQSVESLKNSTKEFKTRKSRINNIVKQYMALPSEEMKSTLIITDINKDKVDITNQLRIELKKNHFIGDEDHTLTTLKAKDLSLAQKKMYWSYKKGDVLVPFSNIENTALKKDNQYTISSINKKTGELSLKFGHFNTKILPEKVTDFSVYHPDKIKVSSGDVLHWTKNNTKRVNKGQVTVDKIEKNLLYLKEEKQPILLNSHQYLDHALVQTTYSSQGQTANSVLFLAESK